MSETNYVIYHRNNRTLQLTNHFEEDGDLDWNYLGHRNRALTGRMIDGKFVSINPKEFNWLIECAKTELSNPHCKHDKRRCRLCNGIFKDVMNNNYEITDFYMNKVVKIIEDHPLYNEIRKIFNGREV